MLDPGGLGRVAVAFEFMSHVITTSARAQWILCTQLHFNLAAPPADRSMDMKREEDGEGHVFTLSLSLARGKLLICVCMCVSAPRTVGGENRITEIICCCQSPLSSTCACQWRRRSMCMATENEGVGEEGVEGKRVSMWLSGKVIKKEAKEGAGSRWSASNVSGVAIFPPHRVRGEISRSVLP